MKATIGFITALFVAFLLTACGAENKPEGPTEAEQAAAAEQKAERQADECEDILSDQIQAQRFITTQTQSGVTYNQLDRSLDQAIAAYDSYDANDLSPACLSEVALPLEGSLNNYIKTWNQWLTMSIGQTRTLWLEGEAKLDQAEDNLDDLADPDSVSGAALPSTEGAAS